MEKMSVTPDEVTMDELQSIAGMMQRHVRNETEESYAQISMALQRRGAFFGLFPTAIQKEHEKLTINKMKSLYNKKEAFFELYTNIQLEVARKRGDALVAAVGADLRAKLAAFVKVKIHEIHGTINESRAPFLASMREQYETVAEYQDIPDLYEPAYEAVREQTGLYFESMSKLLRGFNDAMDSKLNEYKS